jgi:hypothetical protein
LGTPHFFRCFLKKRLGEVTSSLLFFSRLHGLPIPSLNLSTLQYSSFFDRVGVLLHRLCLVHVHMHTLSRRTKDSHRTFQAHLRRTLLALLALVYALFLCVYPSRRPYHVLDYYPLHIRRTVQSWMETKRWRTPNPSSTRQYAQSRTVTPPK